MNWLNLQTKIIRESEFVGSEPISRATWLNVLIYSIEMENGGRIANCRDWKCRQWQQTCGVMLEEVEGADRLLKWDGNDLVIWSYPIDKEREVIHKRELARTNGALGGRPKKPTLVSGKKPTGNRQETNVGTDVGYRTEKTDRKPTLKPTGNQRRIAEGEGKGNEKGNLPAAAPAPAPATPSSAAADGKPEHSEFIRLWCEEYPKHHGGEKYAFQSGKDGIAVKQLLQTSKKTPAELLKMAVCAWAHPAKFHCKLAASICGFNSKFNEIRSELNALIAERATGANGNGRNAGHSAGLDYSRRPVKTPNGVEGGGAQSR